MEQYKRCFQKKINKHIRRYFDAEIANEIGMASGRKRIFTVFEIDKQGKAKIISVKAPHPRLKKEGEWIIKKLPLMKPAVNRNKSLNIKYALRITFNVQ